MTVKNNSVPDDIHVGAIIKGGRWVAFAGFTYVVAWIVGLAIGLTTSSPGPTDSISTIGAHFSSHGEAAMIQAYFLDGLAGASLIVFAVALPSALRPFEGENATLSSILFGGGVAAGTVSLLQGLFTQVLADRVATLGNPAAIRTLFDLNGEGDTCKLLVLGMFLGAAALLVFRMRALPRWLGWVAVVLAPLLVNAGWNFALSLRPIRRLYGALDRAAAVGSGCRLWSVYDALHEQCVCTHSTNGASPLPAFSATAGEMARVIESEAEQ